jgi:uncharacterized protein
MIYFVIATVSLLASVLTFFSGFGLGTILLPVFALFFDLPTSILLTAIVHFLNNVFKFILVGKHVDWRIFVTFGIPSLIAAFAGAWLLKLSGHSEDLFSYEMAGHIFHVNLTGLLIGVLMIVFALWEVIPELKNISFSRNKLIAGGFLSGFFGGLSGHQGALRSAFLLRLDLSKEVYIATGISIACVVDIARMSVYSTTMNKEVITGNFSLLAVGVVSAWLGALIGNKLLRKTTLDFIKWFVLVFMLMIGLLVAAGVINK